VPSLCRNGVCTTCAAKVTQGGHSSYLVCTHAGTWVACHRPHLHTHVYICIHIYTYVYVHINTYTPSTVGLGCHMSYTHSHRPFPPSVFYLTCDPTRHLFSLSSKPTEQQKKQQSAIESLSPEQVARGFILCCQVCFWLCCNRGAEKKKRSFVCEGRIGVVAWGGEAAAAWLTG
jgi:hypothetical protein